MSKNKKKSRRKEPGKRESPPDDSKQSITLPANPPHPNRALLIISGVLLVAWLAFLFCVAMFG